jgi:hypothetical protein
MNQRSRTTFLFIFSPNNSGTTAMCQYLQQQCDGYLPPFGNYEGQMAPTLRKMMRNEPWNPDNHFDWAHIRAEWERLATEAGMSIFVEGSPPNILRVDQIVEAFGGDMQAAFAISSPYAQVSSAIKNYYNDKISDDVLAEFARFWQFKADAQKKNVLKYRERFPLIRYEDFCRDPGIVNQAFGIAQKQPQPIAGKKNSQVTKIVDLTVKNISFLTGLELMTLTEVLAERQDLLDFFGYPLLDAAAHNDLLSQNLGLMQAGLLDRIKWESKAGRNTGGG